MKYLGSITDPKDLVNKEYVDDISDMIADEYDGSSTYNVDDYCVYNGVLYRCKVSGTTGVWNSGNWIATSVGNSLTRTNLIDRATALANGDLNDYITNHVYFISGPNTLENKPDGLVSGMLEVFRLYNFVYQRITYNKNNIGTFAYRRYSINTSTWNDWTYVNQTQIDKINSNIVDYNAYDILPSFNTLNNTTSRGITFERNDKTYHVYGTLSEGETFSYANIYSSQNALPTGIEAGKSYYIKCNTDNENVKLQIFPYINGTLGSATTFISDKIYTVPANCTGLIIRLYFIGATSVNSYITVGVLNSPSNDSLFDIIQVIPKFANINDATALTSGNLNDYKTANELYFISTPNTLENLPETGISGLIEIYNVKNFTYQRVTYVKGGIGKIAFRRCSSSTSTWNDWQILNTGNVYNNTQNFNSYSNTYNVTATPSITADTHNYLAPSGTNADRKNDIETLLNTTGACILGPGDYYVSGIDMPNNSYLGGSGRATRIILLGESTDEGYAVHFTDDCTVENMSVIGSETAVSVTNYNYVNRHGILWESDYGEGTPASTITRRRGIVSNCNFVNFTGGGVTCYNTGTPVNSCIMVTNCFFYQCMVGINIQRYSEFNIFTSCHVRACYYGCINNGGNNLFTTCHFSANKVGMLLDNSFDQSPNNSHGSVIGCTFDHADSNNGVGIKVDGCQNGEVFSDCQVFYADIEVNNSQGIQFNNLNTGRQVDVKVTKGENGGLVMFNNCVFWSTSDYSITVDSGYTACKFNNCWTRNGTAVTG